MCERKQDRKIATLRFVFVALCTYIHTYIRMLWPRAHAAVQLLARAVAAVESVLTCSETLQVPKCILY